MGKLVEIWENIPFARFVLTVICYCGGLLLYFGIQLIFK